MKGIIKLERAFLWAASIKSFGRKSKVKWDLAYQPEYLGGLGVIDLEKIVRALRRQWPWFEWMDLERAWVGLGAAM